jgi:hypothetical protein
MESALPDSADLSTGDSSATGTTAGRLDHNPKNTVAASHPAAPVNCLIRARAREREAADSRPAR